MKLYKYFILIASLISTVISFQINSGPFIFLPLIPIAYGVLFYFIIPKETLLGPGFLTMALVLFFRYLVYPPVFKYDGFFYDNNLEPYIKTAIIIQLVEILVILLTIRYFTNRRVFNHGRKFKNKNTFNKQFNEITRKINYQIQPIENTVKGFIPVILSIIGVIIIVTHPNIYINKHFFLNTVHIISKKTIFESDGWSVILRLAEIYLTLYLASIVYSSKKSLFWCSIILILPNLFYVGNSRLSMLIPLIATMFLLIKLFQKNKKKIFISLGVLTFISMIGLTIVKSFGSTSIQSIDLHSSAMINSYFGGTENVAIGLKANDKFSDQISIHTFTNDMFRNAMGISSLFSSTNNSSYFFNETFYSSKAYVSYDQIIPTISQGVFYFGYLFFWILTIIMVTIVLKADRMFADTRRIEYAWVFAFLSISVGWAVPGSFQHLYVVFHQTFIPLIIIVYLNNRLKFA